MARREISQIAGLILVEPKKFGDHRGFFSETYNRERMAALGFSAEFIQDNHALSGEAGTLRGVHYQSPPFAQDKLVRVVRGRILDVAVDIRRGSPSFGRHCAIELSADNGLQLWVPVGFAHGFCTLEPDCEVVYMVTDYYSKDDDLGLAFDDPALAIEWPCDPAAATLSEKDRRQPRLAELPDYFPQHPSVADAGRP